MGFKVIETEEELRTAYNAGLMWWKYEDDLWFHREDLGFGEAMTVKAWKGRGYADAPSKWSWEAYVLVEDDDD